MISSDDIATTGMMIIKEHTNGFERMWKVTVVQISPHCEIPGFRRGVNEAFALLCFRTAFVGSTGKIFDLPKFDRQAVTKRR